MDNVIALEVVTGAGRRMRCSPTRAAGLFDAVLAGLGQCAVIMRASVRLRPATPVGAIPVTQPDWVQHFGASWPELARAKRRYDPAGILTPGQRIFARPPA